jgi:hypothetical protein
LITTAAIAGIDVPTPGSTPDTTVSSGAGYTATITWSGALTFDGKFRTDPQYNATISLTAAPGYTLTGVAANFFTVAGANSVTNGANSGVVTAVFPGVVYSIGDTGPAGGFIFMTPSTRGGLGGVNYYEAASADLIPTFFWCASVDGTFDGAGNVGATGLHIGSGRSNTAEIVGGNTGASCLGGAGVAADAYSSTGATPYADWFLPSTDELNQLCRFAKSEIQSLDQCTINVSMSRGNFAPTMYWSSSEIGLISAFSLLATPGIRLLIGKDASSVSVRPVRAFE